MVSTRELATVLFTDIVGSTEHASRLGDRGWRELLRLHDERVRAELERYEGREVNTVGDGFVATFDDPERAIRCACAIRTAVAPLGLAVRCGLHMGEVEREGREIRGIAVHIGARVAAQADPGEVLVSSTVREMVAGSGFGFEDRGARPLKGVPGEWRLSAVTSEPARVPVAGRWRVVRRRLPRLTPGHVVLAAVAAFVLLVALSSLYFRDPRAERGGGPRPVIAAGSPLGVAVLPFSVTSPRLADWRESMVTLLTTNLDGLGGLRAIDSRTVLARWRERIPAGGSPDLQAMLDVARQAGARYALVGSAVSLGDRVRLSVDVYDLEEGAHLGHGQVDGGSEGVFQMVDALTIRVLEALAEEDERELPGVSLASVTTDSLAALRHFLAGEAAFRRSDFDRAISAYEKAVAIDSTFALALYRLWYASAWIENVAAAAPFLERAARFRARLPERQALLLEAARDFVGGRVGAIPRLENVVRTYPDDTEAWNLLGEAFFHLGAQALVGQEQSDSAFSRAVQLDPAFAPSHVHLVENAFTLYADSALAARRIDAYGRLAAGTDLDRRNRIAFGLAFADSAGRARARSALAGGPAFELLGIAINYLWHPRFLAVQGELLERAVRRPEEGDAERARVSLFANRLARGRLQDALRLAGDASFPRRFRGEALYAARQLGAEVEVSRLEVELRSTDSDSLPDLRLLGSAALAADRGQWADHAAALDRVRALADTAWAAGDSAGAEYARAVAQGLQGYALWKDGRAADAVPLLEAAQRRATGWGERAKVNAALRFWLGSLLLEVGRDADAGEYLAPRPAERFNSRTLGVWYWQDALAAYRLGQAYERLGRTEEAVASYRYAVESWEEVDPSLGDLVLQAREALGRLGPPSARPPLGAVPPN